MAFPGTITNEPDIEETSVGTSYTSASYTISSGETLVVACTTARADYGTGLPPSTLSWDGNSLTLIEDWQEEAVNLSIWYLTGESGSGTLSFTFGSSMDGLSCKVATITNIDGSLEQAAAETNDVTVSYPGATTNDNLAFAALTRYGSATGPTFTPRTNWTQIGAVAEADAPFPHAMATEWYDVSDTAASGSWSGGGEPYGGMIIALEFTATGGSSAIDGSTAGTSTVTGTLDGAGDLDASEAGTSTASGTLSGVGDLAATEAGTSTATATGVAYALADATGAGTSSVSGTLLGAGSLDATEAGTSSVTGTLDGAGDLQGSIAGTSTASGTLAAPGDMSATEAGTSTASGTLSGVGDLDATEAGTSSVTGTLDGAGDLQGTIAGTSTVTGTLAAPSMEASADGTSTVTGTLSGAGDLQGSIAGTSTVTATISGGPAPEVLSTTETSFGNATDHVVDLPATIADNDGILVAFYSNGSSSVTHTTPSGYTLVGTGTSSNMRMSLYQKDVVTSGDGGGTVNIVTSSAQPGAAHVFRLEAGTYSGNVEVQFGTGGTTVDNPSITPSWGLASNLYLAIASWREGSGPITAAPSGYSTAVITDLGGTGLASCYLQDESSSEDPGAWTDSGTIQACELTVAVQPFVSEVDGTGTAAGTSTASGTLSGVGDLDATEAGTSTVSGSVTGILQADGTASGTSTVTGMLVGLGAGESFATAAGVALAVGTLLGSAEVAGTTAGSSTATATLAVGGDLRIGSATIPSKAATIGSKTTVSQSMTSGQTTSTASYRLGPTTATKV